MKKYFDELKNIRKRFFFIFGNTDDCFCGKNFIAMNLKYTLNKHLKDCGYERVVFYGLNEQIHFYDDESYNLTLPKNTSKKTETNTVKKTPMLIKGPLISKMTVTSRQSDKPVAIETTNDLHFGGMTEVDAFNMIDFCMKDKNIKTAVVITNADYFINFFGAQKNMWNKVFDSLNIYSGLGHEYSNIMIFIFPSQSSVSLHNENEAPVWEMFFKPILKEEKVTEIHIGPPLIGEIRNTINYFRITHKLKLDFHQLDTMCKNIAKNYYSEKPTLDSLDFLMMKLKDLVKKNIVLNNETVDILLKYQGDDISKGQHDFLTTIDFRGILMKLSEKEIRQAKDIAQNTDEEASIDDILRDLDNMVGMSEVKKKIRSIAHKISIQKEREEKASAEAIEKGETWEQKENQKQGNHMVITGNPGTGKNTIIRMLPKLFKAIRALPTNKFIELNGNDLSAGYVGQTKDNVNDYYRRALGGVLFIDEAYVLANEHGPVDDYAKQAAETLMTHLENNRDKFICIIAGYKDKIDLFLDKINPGMRSRFNHFLNIDDYNAVELYEIFEKEFVKKGGLILSNEAKEAARKAIETMWRKKPPDFANARAVRQLYDDIISRQSERISALPKEERTFGVLNTIEAADIGEAVKPVSVNDVLADLDAMVGMIEVKKIVRSIANKLIYYKKIIEQTGKAPDGEGNNICITGNPGTGKNTIARILAKLFKAIGLLTDDEPLEILGADLKAPYLGQTKDKVNGYCRQAIGRVLFIDEAYSLVDERGPVDDYANEAITVLLAHLENDRDKFVCVVAGYPKEMDLFIEKSNRGMKRRFKHYIHLPDYSAEELIEIFERFNVKKAGFTLTDAARDKAREAIHRMVANKESNFGNAGDIRTFFENITTNTANRVSRLPDDQQSKVLQVIEAEDIP